MPEDFPGPCRVGVHEWKFAASGAYGVYGCIKCFKTFKAGLC